MILNNTFLFVHIPKTGGTSFRKGIESVFGSENTFYDYGSNSDITSSIIKECKYIEKDIFSLTNTIVKNESKTLICGHVPILDYAHLVKPENIITFLRDPIQRVISNFEHMKRHGSYQGCLEDFVKDDMYSNLQSKFLKGFPPEAIGFIGITEFYNRSIDLLESQVSIRTPSLMLNINKEVLGGSYEVSKEISSLIQQKNATDIEFYARAKQIFQQREDFSLDSASDIYGYIDDLNVNFVAGWCYGKGDGLIKPQVLDIFRGSQKVGECSASSIRPYFKQINAPRGGFIGFKYFFDTPLRAGEVITCKPKGKKGGLLGLSSLIV